MKYTQETIINAPLSKTIKLFDDPDNLDKWQPGFISMEHISGEDGMSGAKYRLKYKIGKRKIEMIETIVERDLPRVFSATYEADKVWNEVVNRFEKTANNQTKYIVENEFRMAGGMKILA